jgi:hypothetical protein
LATLFLCRMNGLYPSKSSGGKSDQAMAGLRISEVPP